MSSLIASFRGEWSKLIRRRKYFVFLGIGIIICLLWVGIGQLISGFLSHSGALFINLTPTPMGVLPFFLRVLIPFLMFMGVTDLITVEQAEHTMKAMVSRPVERWKLYTAKLLAVVCYATLYLCVVFVLSTVLNQVFGEAQSVGDILITLASYALTLVPICVLACFAALIALFGKSGTLTMFLLLLIYLALSVLPIIFPVLTEMLFTSYLGWYKLWIGALPAAGKLMHMLLIVLGYGVFLFTAGSLLFDRKEY